MDKTVIKCVHDDLPITRTSAFLEIMEMLGDQADKVIFEKGTEAAYKKLAAVM